VRWCKEVDSAESLDKVRKLRNVEEAEERRSVGGGRRLYRQAVKGLPSDFAALRRGERGNKGASEGFAV
jgi:hypothetical protein